MKKVNPAFLFKAMQYRVKMTEQQVIVAHKNSLINNGH